MPSQLLALKLDVDLELRAGLRQVVVQEGFSFHLVLGNLPSTYSAASAVLVVGVDHTMQYLLAIVVCSIPFCNVDGGDALFCWDWPPLSHSFTPPAMSVFVLQRLCLTQRTVRIMARAMLSRHDNSHEPCVELAGGEVQRRHS